MVLGLGISPLGGAKDTTLNIRDTGEFVVNLVDEPIAEAMNLCAIDFPPEISEIEVAGLDLAAERAIAPPRIAAGAGQSGMPALRHAPAGARALSGDRRGARGARPGRHPRPGDAAGRSRRLCADRTPVRRRLRAHPRPLRDAAAHLSRSGWNRRGIAAGMNGSPRRCCRLRALVDPSRAFRFGDSPRRPCWGSCCRSQRSSAERRM